jgi:hypothetical protein
MESAIRSRSSGTPILADQLAEEAADDQPPRLGQRDAAGHQVEQVLVLPAPAGARVPGADHLAR